jgi:predicted AlkP superfamily pyrophosphatase or phosphodiesterase
VKVVLLVLDAQPHRHVSPETTPVLARLAASGGRAPSGGRAVLTSATYPNHASFVTGTDAVGHGLYANHVVRDGRVRRAHDVGPSSRTLFDACRDASRTAVAVFGDHHLVPVMGAAIAASHWPPDGALPAGRRLDDLGYLHDSETIGPLCAAGAEPFDLLVAQLNGPDTAAHLHGPDSPAAIAVYTETDGYVGQLVDALAPAWDETVLMVVSDHDQTTLDRDLDPVDLQAVADAAGLDVTVVLEGDGAVVVGEDPDEGRWLLGVDGVSGTVALAPGLRFVSAVPGRWFARAGTPAELVGIHGGLATRTQVAIVSGGHPAVPRLAAGLARRIPDAADWAVTVAELLSLELLGATGRSLLA